MANRALHLKGVADFQLVETEIPETPAKGVLVKVAYAGICHSDVHLSQSPLDPKFEYPRVFGHEVSGTLHDIGEETAKSHPELKKNDNVIVYPWGNCNTCNVCQNDLSYCCNIALPTGTGPNDTYVYGVYKDGGYQQYMAIHDPSFIIKVPDGLPMDQAALVPCSGITTLNASLKLKESIDTALKVNGKALVGIIGAGGLGLWSIQMIKALYPPEVKVVAIDIMKEKLDDAKAHGADFTFQWGTDEPVEEVVGSYLKTGGDFLDGAIDLTGIAAVQYRIFALLNVGGTITLVGLGGDKIADFPLTGLFYKNASIKANLTGTRAHCREVMDMLIAGKVKPPPITIVTLDQVVENINKLKEGKQRGRAVAEM